MSAPRCGQKSWKRGSRFARSIPQSASRPETHLSHSLFLSSGEAKRALLTGDAARHVIWHLQREDRNIRGPLEGILPLASENQSIRRAVASTSPSSFRVLQRGEGEGAKAKNCHRFSVRLCRRRRRSSSDRVTLPILSQRRSQKVQDREGAACSLVSSFVR